jgi:hypothetical protein
VLNHLVESLRLFDMASNPHLLRGMSGQGGKMPPRQRARPGGDLLPLLPRLRLPTAHVAQTYRQLLQGLYARPARIHGFPRWGLVETGADKFTCDMLRFLYPEAKIVLLLRDPLDCVGECLAHGLRPRDRWGELTACDDPGAWFAGNWARLSEEFARVDGAHAVRYEDLAEPGMARGRLAEYLEMDFAAEAFADWSSRRPGSEASGRTGVPSFGLSVLRAPAVRWGYALDKRMPG